MSEPAERAAQLLLQALDHEEGDERIAMSEEAVTAADLSGDYYLQYMAREQLVRACTFGGEPEKALVAFSWMLAHFEKRPDGVSDWSVLWKYKWIISGIHEFPHIPNTRIYEMFGDFEARAVRAGFGLKAAYNFRYRFERFRGERERAIEFYRKMDETPEDDLSNCSACILDERVSFAIYNGQEAIALAAPILDGHLSCKSVPHRTYAKLLLPLVQLGQDKEAQNYHRAGYRLVRQNKTYLDRVAQHLVFLAVTRQLERGLTLFKKHVIWLEQTRNVYHHFLFYIAAWLLFEALAKAGNGRIKMRRPEDKHGREAKPEISALRYKHNATVLAARFDERNKTDRFSTMLRDLNVSNAVEVLATL